MQELKDKPWRNEELRSSEEGLPRLREENLEKAASKYNATKGVGGGWIAPQDSARLVNTNERRHFESVEQCGRWPQQACAAMFS